MEIDFACNVAVVDAASIAASVSTHYSITVNSTPLAICLKILWRQRLINVLWRLYWMDIASKRIERSHASHGTQYDIAYE